MTGSSLVYELFVFLVWCKVATPALAQGSGLELAVHLHQQVALAGWSHGGSESVAAVLQLLVFLIICSASYCSNAI